MKKECRLIMAAACAVLFQVSMQPALADVTNGTFDTDLSGWNVESGVVLHELVGGDGKALFKQDDDDEDPSSILSQPFTLDPLSLTLSFDREMESFVPGETDTFTASLLDSSDNPLVSYSGETYFYSLNSQSPPIEETATGVTVTGNTVSLDVSSWAGDDVKLLFALEHEYDDQFTSVLVDNVSVSLVPVPGAFVLGSLGLCFAGWRFRKRRLI